MPRFKIYTLHSIMPRNSLTSLRALLAEVYVFSSCKRRNSFQVTFSMLGTTLAMEEKGLLLTFRRSASASFTGTTQRSPDFDKCLSTISATCRGAVLYPQEEQRLYQTQMMQLLSSVQLCYKWDTIVLFLTPIISLELPIQLVMSNICNTYENFKNKIKNLLSFRDSNIFASDTNVLRISFRTSFPFSVVALSAVVVTACLHCSQTVFVANTYYTVCITSDIICCARSC